MPTETFGFILSDAARLLRRRFDARARSMGVTRAQWQVLMSLSRNEGINQAGLADRLEVENITLCRMIDRLSEAGLVERRADPADRRIWRLHLTEAARPLIEKMLGVAAEVTAEALAGLTSDDRERLAGLLDTVRTNLSARPLSQHRVEEVIVMEMRKIDTATATPLIEEPTPSKSWTRLALMLGLPVILLAVLGWYFLAGKGTVSTDNAYVRQDKVSVSPDVTGRIVEVAVDENQPVARGALLFRLDPTPYRIALAQADAAVASARLQVSQLRTGLATKGVDIRGANEDVRFAQQDMARQQQLLKEGFTTRARFDQASHVLSQAREALANARAESANAAAALGNVNVPLSQHPLVLSAIAQRNKAVLELSRTEIRAPAAGIVSQTGRLQVGNIAAAGLPLISIVRSDKTWVDANFKETDLKAMAVGQSATVTLDAYGKGPLRGRVASIGAGTGSEFSVLPAQNASGNWVKVTQRVPVRIELLDRPDRPLIAGLSAKVTVKTAD